jgi:hypothetical protein
MCSKCEGSCSVLFFSKTHKTLKNNARLVVAGHAAAGGLAARVAGMQPTRALYFTQISRILQVK